MKDKLKDYHALPHAKRAWLPNPWKIGGRPTDISEIGISLADAIRDSFPMNEVPLAIAEQHALLQVKLEEVEDRLFALINQVSRALQE